MAIPLEAIEGKYEILEKITEGGMGAVYKVRHRFLDETRVIKVMRPQLAADERARERFVREAKLASGLRHVNIAQLFDFAIDDKGNAYLVMEYIEGVTLQELLKLIGAPQIGLCLEIARQSLDALGYLHNRGIVHRDISPDNIMVSIDEIETIHAKLIDLGIAKLVESDGAAGLTATGMFVGKVKYSSPEHFRTQDGIKVDSRSDLYSFGVVLYELLTGRHPIKGSGVSNLIAGHLFHPPEPFAKVDPEGRIPADLQSIIFKALAKSPDERPGTAEGLAADLRSIQERYPPDRQQLRNALQMHRVSLATLVQHRPGSTQRHLDSQFGPTATPAPPQSLRPVTESEGPDRPTEHVRLDKREESGRVVKTAPEDPSLARTSLVGQASRRTEPAGAASARTMPMDSSSGDATIAEVTAPESSRHPQEAARPAKRRTAALLAAAAVVVVAAAAAFWLLPQPAVAPTDGVLVIDAVPWAEVTSVHDAAGASVPLAGPAYTPFRLAVPPGSYQVVVKTATDQQELEVEVAADETVRRVATFSQVDVDDFFRGLGWE